MSGLRAGILPPMFTFPMAGSALRGWVDALEARPRARALTLGALFVGLTALGARIAVPLPYTPVPVTLQTFFVLLAGVALGARGGAASMAAYVVLGFAGLPLFAAGSAGPGVVLGPTGGYLLGFPLAAAAAGWIAGGRRSIPNLALAWLVGTSVVFLCGVSHLSVVTGLGIDEAAALGLTPFLPGAILKAAVGIALTVRYRQRFGSGESRLP
jgi:biotin transport system substrate-specific component